MSKRKVFIAIHQLNIGGAQKALISALNAIDYTANDVTLYVRKNRLELLPAVNKNISKIIINKDNTKYYRKPYAAFWTVVSFLQQLLKIDNTKTEEKIRNYIVKSQIKYEKKHYISDEVQYDVAVSYIQDYTAKSVAENVNANKKVVFYHGSTDPMHSVNVEVFAEFDKIYCVSKGAMQAVKSFYPEYAEKFDYVVNFVDAENVKLKSNAFVPDFDKSKLTLCTCGRMTEEKGFDIAVEAAEILKNQGIDFKWWFVSDGRYRNYIDKLIKEKNLNEYICITGMVDNPYPYIKNCDIYVQPSYEESFGLTIFEAVILESIVITTNTVGARDIVLDNCDGFIVDIDANSLADKILCVSKNKELKKQIKQELEKKDYSKDYQTFCKKWETLLEGK